MGWKRLARVLGGLVLLFTLQRGLGCCCELFLLEALCFHPSQVLGLGLCSLPRFLSLLSGLLDLRVGQLVLLRSGLCLRLNLLGLLLNHLCLLLYFLLSCRSLSLQGHALGLDLSGSFCQCRLLSCYLVSLLHQELLLLQCLSLLCPEFFRPYCLRLLGPSVFLLLCLLRLLLLVLLLQNLLLLLVLLLLLQLLLVIQLMLLLLDSRLWLGCHWVLQGGLTGVLSGLRG